MSGKQFLGIILGLTLPWFGWAFLVDLVYLIDEVANKHPTHPYYMYERVVHTPALWVWVSYTIVLAFSTPRWWMGAPILGLVPPLLLYFGGGYVWLGWAGGLAEEFAEWSKLGWLLSHIPGAESVWEWMFPAEFGCRNTPTCGP